MRRAIVVASALLLLAGIAFAQNVAVPSKLVVRDANNRLVGSVVSWGAPCCGNSGPAAAIVAARIGGQLFTFAVTRDGGIGCGDLNPFLCEPKILFEQDACSGAPMLANAPNNGPDPITGTLFSISGPGTTLYYASVSAPRSSRTIRSQYTDPGSPCTPLPGGPAALDVSPASAIDLSARFTPPFTVK